MIRPFAPALTTLRFLRQLVFPRAFDVGVALNRCPRMQLSDHRPFSVSMRTEVKPTLKPTAPKVARRVLFGKHRARPLKGKGLRLRPPGKGLRQWQRQRQRWRQQPTPWMIMRKRKPKPKPKKIFTPLYEIPLYRRWKRLLQSDFGEARTQFMSLRAGKSLFPAQDVDKMARALMLALHHRGHFASVPRVFFHQVELVGRPSSVHSLNLCLESYRRQQRWDRVLELCRVWTAYTRDTEPESHVFRSGKTHEMYVRALVETGMMHKAFQAVDSLYSTPCTIAYYLRKMAQRLPSFDEFHSLFQQVVNRHFKKKAPLKLYNIVLEEALLARKTEVAKYYIDVMRTISIKPDAYTFGAILRMQTMVGDWNGVGKTLEQILDKGLIIPPRNITGMVEAYARSHNISELEDFFGALLSEGIQPPATSFNSMIRETLRKRRYESMINWATRMKEMGVLPNDWTFELLYKAIGAAKLADESALLNRITNLIASINKSLVPRRLANPIAAMLDENSLALSEIDAGSDSDPTSEIDAGSDSDPTSDLRIDEEYMVHQINDAISSNKPEEAIRIFRDNYFALRRSRRVRSTLINAYINLPDDFDNSRSDLRPLPLSTVLDLHNTLDSHIKSAISGTNTPGESRTTPRNTILYPYVLASYKISAYHNTPLTHAITVSCAAALIDLADPLAAVRLMNDISKTPFGTLADWNIEAFTVLLRAYSELKDLRGICWVVGRIIDSGLLPDRRVQIYLHRMIRSDPGEEQVEILQELKRRCHQARLEHQRKVHSVVQEFILLVEDQALTPIPKRPPPRFGLLPMPRELKRLRDILNGNYRNVAYIGAGSDQDPPVVRKVKVRAKFVSKFKHMKTMWERRGGNAVEHTRMPEVEVEDGGV